MPITNAAEAEQEYFEALNLACDFTRRVVEHHRKKLKEDDKTPPAAARMWVNVMAEVHRLRADYVRSRPRPDSTIPDDPRFAEIGKALAIGDSWGAAQRVMKLFYDPPPILKTYWFKVFADKRKQSLKPPLAERPSLVTSDSGVNRIEPEPEPYVRYPMPDDGTPVPDEIEQSFDEMGGHMPSPALAMDTTNKLTPHLEAAMEDAWRDAGEPDGFDEG